MKKLITIISAMVLVGALNSCSISGPLTSTNILVTDNPIGSKVGVAERKIFLGITLGHTDLSLRTAAANGGISKIATVDYKIKGGLFTTTYSVVVTGE